MAIKHNAESGDLYRDESGQVWRVVGYQPNPTVILEALVSERDLRDGLSPPSTQTHAVGCRNADGFTPLNPE